MKSILSVTTAASSFDLTTLVNVKSELSITNGSSDVVLKRYISGASQAAALYCNRVFVVETVTERFLPGRSTCLIRSNINSLKLARWPLIAVTSAAEGEDILTAVDDFLVDAENGQLIRVNESGLPRTWSNLPITVVYSAGYAQSTIPSDLEDAVIRMVTKRYSAKGRDSTLKAESIPGVIDRQFWIATGGDAGNMTPDVTDILDNYRVPVMA